MHCSSRPRVFILQTRGPLILRDLKLLLELSQRTKLRVSFSVTTDREEVRRSTRPHCADFGTAGTIARCAIPASRLLRRWRRFCPATPNNSRRLRSKPVGRDLSPTPSMCAVLKRTARRRAKRRLGECAHQQQQWIDPGFQQRSSSGWKKPSRNAGTLSQPDTRDFGCELAPRNFSHGFWAGCIPAPAGTRIRKPGGEHLASHNPADGSELGRVRMAGAEDYDEVLRAALQTFEKWRMVPAPKRGEIVREIGDELRAQRTTWARWSRSKWARSWPKARAKCRR